MSRKQRSLALTIFSATVILASSILGAALYSSEAASGGIEMKWRMNLYNGETYVCQFNDLTVVNDKDAKQLRFIDTDGNTVRNHQYMDFFGLEGYFAFSGDRFYYFDSYNGSRMLVCLGANGSTEWTLSDPRVSGVYAGADGNMYLQSQTPSLQANISNTVICIDGDGVQRWAVTESYAVGVWAEHTIACRIMENGWDRWRAGHRQPYLDFFQPFSS